MPFDEANLTSKEILGLDWEKAIQSLLDENRISHYSNPTEPHQWKSHIGFGVDSILSIFGILVGVEMKYSNCKVYPSHIRDDFLPRFRGSYDFRIVLTNDKSKYAWSSQRLLYQNGIRLFNKVDLVNWYYRLLYEHSKSKNGISSVSKYQGSDVVKYQVRYDKRYNNRLINNITTKTGGLGDETDNLGSDSLKEPEMNKFISPFINSLYIEGSE